MERIWRSILIGFFVFNAFGAYAQNEKRYDYEIDKLTYRLFAEQKWDSLIDISEKAQYNQIDFYYLDIRLGVAYFNKELYIKAINCFDKVLLDYPKDPFVLEYLYFANQYVGKSVQATNIARNMSQELRSYLGIKLNTVNMLLYEGGYNISDNFTKNDHINRIGEDSLYCEHDMTGNYLYQQVGIKHSLFSRIQLFHGLSLLRIDKLKHIEAKEPSAYINKNFKYSDNQLGYYLGAEIPLKKNMVLAPALHYIQDRFENTNIIFDSTGKYIEIKNMQLINSGDISSFYYLNQYDTMLTSYAISLQLSYYHKRAIIAPSFAFVNIAGDKHAEFAISYSFFPKGNLNNYYNTEIKFIKEKQNNRFIIKQLIGKKLSSKWWGEYNISYGDLSNSTEGNGLIIYNNPDKAPLKTGINLIYLFNKKIEFSLRYNYLYRKTAYLQYYLDDDTKSDINLNYATYNNHYIIGGIKWKIN